MADTRIEWTDAVWNPVTGCTKVSEGCRHCYAETFAHRGMGPWRGRAFTEVRCHEDRLNEPLRWRKPRRVFVNSMSDLFHPDVPDAFILRVLDKTTQAKQHIFQILTKRPERMREFFERYTLGHIYGLGHAIAPNVWLGVSVEDQATADARIPQLLQAPAAVRFVSCEPLLGPVDFARPEPEGITLNWLRGAVSNVPRLNWVIVGGESGPQARPCDIAWIRGIVQQCEAAWVPCFVKQLGARAMDEQGDMHGRYSAGGIKHDFPALLSRKGNDPSEWPTDLRVREMPR